MRIVPLRYKLLGLLALFAIALGLAGPSTTYASGTFIGPEQLTTYVVKDAYYNSGVTLEEDVPSNPAYTNILISDQKLLRTGWIVKIDNELMRINNLIEGGIGNPDTMVVFRAQGGTSVAAHSQGTMIKGRTVTVDIWAKEVTDPYGLGAFQVNLTFPSNVQYIKMSVKTSWLASTGRDPWCSGPTQVGDAWQVSCFTLGDPQNPGQPPGPTGSGLIATVTVLPPESGIGTVSLDGSLLLNTPGEEIPATPQNMSFRVVDCPDVDLNGVVNILDSLQTALQWGDRGKDCGLTLWTDADTSQTTLEINDQSLAWWESFNCGAPDTNRPDTIAIDAEIVSTGEFVEGGSPDTVTVTRAINSTQARSHLAGAPIYIAPSQWDGNYDGKNGYTPTRDVDHNGFINILDSLVTVYVWGMQCP